MRIYHILKVSLLYTLPFWTLARVSVVQGQSKLPAYEFDVDLTKVENDQLRVVLKVPAIKQKEVIYYLPQIVPGIYSKLDFGQFVSNFRAETVQGRQLKHEKVGKNGWKIHNARQLYRLSYTVDDGYETHKDLGNKPYQSAASSFVKDELFVINHNCLFGYFDGMTKLPVRLTFVKPLGFFGATSLLAIKKQPTKDVFLAADYRSLIDAPLMYSQPDTTVIKVANTKITVAVHSHTGNKYSAGIAQHLKSLLKAQKDYLGGTLPVNHYSFIISHGIGKPGSITGDALEHSYSSFYLFAASNDELDPIASLVRKIASHEFFHIVTPLNIHSEEIANYDFNQPKMSQHLWLYEGMTEYATLHMPVKQKLQGVAEFLQNVRQKIVNSRKFNNRLSFTQMSKNILNLSNQYYNVYLKGALIGLCLDIRLRELSNGKYGTQHLLQDLSAKYGKHKPFKDKELIAEIAKMTFPEIRHFFTDYVINAKALPLKEYLLKVGISYDAKDDHFRPVKNITDQQKRLRKAWLGR
ncbi:peptidase, M61 (glycyl aminopeptidase) family protein [Microscilla marina ATCC 23134]|uniref:Peptidase, M61 (Glycyl aminopeptidase) family protein n=1 Tax=Microscilla marina ATCC 23134 TaxID=313606 RepID=A1ZP40_MICM2|nr:peptidase, M61 (glycyl aminopeptidase) family protein [Microscilla marina ATCC 23134]